MAIDRAVVALSISELQKNSAKKVSGPTTMDEAGDEWQGHGVSSITFVIIRVAIYVGE